MNRTLQLILMVMTFAGAAISPATTLAADTNPEKTNRSSEDWMKGVHFILGVYNVEDLIQIPGTRWIIGSGLTTYSAGMKDQVITKNYLHLFDAKTETGRQIEPDDIAIRTDTYSYPGSTPPDWETFGPHGISLGARNGDVFTLYAVNHGGRDSIEVFEIDISSDSPRFTWVGNVVVPSDGWPDAVAWLPDTGGIVVTAMIDPRDPEGSMQKQMKGEPVGWVKEWHNESGWKVLPGTEGFSNPNGVVVSEDGRHVWVAESAEMRITRVTRGAKPELAHAKVDGIPDNLRWAADGQTILAGVHTVPPKEFMEKQVATAKTGANMLTTWNLTRIDSDSMETEILMPSAIYGDLGAATVAIEVGPKLWVGSTKADRIGIFDLKP